MNALRIALAAGLTLAVIPGATSAQGGVAGPPKPDVMLLINSGRTMGLQVGFDAQSRAPLRVKCALSAGMPDPTITYTRSRLETIKAVLTGRSASEAQDGYWCTVGEAQPVCGQAPGGSRLFSEPACGIDAVIPHSQSMCCATRSANGCSVWKRCGADSGVFTDQNGLFQDEKMFVPYEPGNTFTTDGLIHSTRLSVRWGLMTTDGDPEGGSREDGAFSYPRALNLVPDPLMVSPKLPFFVPPNLDPNAPRPLDGLFFVRSADEGNRLNRPNFAFNLGIRNEYAPFGGLVAGGWRYDPATGVRTNVGDSVSEVGMHNAFVAGRVRSMTPSREAPLAAALADAVDHFEREAAGGGDPSFACRQKSLVVVTDQGVSDYFGGKPCVGDAECVFNNGLVQGACVPLQSVDEAASATPARVCRLPEGYPYPAPAVSAARLRALGVPVFIVAFSAYSNHPNAVAREDRVRSELKRIAQVGSPGMGYDGLSDGYFRADDADQLRRALEHIVNGTQAGFVGHTRPLVLSPRKGDGRDLDNNGTEVAQWRINAFSEVPGGGDTYRYGRIERVDYGCARGAGGAADAPGARDIISRARFDALFATRDRGALPRRSVTRSVDRSAVLAVLGGGGASVFGQNGELGQALPRPTVVSMLGLTGSAEDVAAGLSRSGLLVNGYFGARGVQNGLPVTAQLGEIFESDLAPIVAPQLDLTSPAYQAYAQSNRDRPTLMAAGANDGQVHVYRVDDGFEVLNFVPRSAWSRMNGAPVVRTVNGPMESGDIAACRALGQGNATCPQGLNDASFRTMLVGGVGRDAPNIYGVDLTYARGLVRREGGADGARLNFAELFKGAGPERPYVWDVTDELPTLIHQENGLSFPLLGPSISKPALTHVRYDDGGTVVVRGAVIVGCGDDGEAGLTLTPMRRGRCVLILDASTGEVIKRIDDRSGRTGVVPMNAPMTGSVAVWPSVGVAPAERAFIGDAFGRMWRIDLRSSNRAAWKATAIFPFEDSALNNGFESGRAVIGRPALSLREGGALSVVFANSELSIGLGAQQSAPRSAVVSLTDAAVLGAGGALNFEASPAYVLPLADNEVVTGEPVVFDGTLLFTTAQSSLVACASSLGRLYGVHAWETLRAPNGAPRTFVTQDNRRLSVVPKLPVFNQDGTPSEPALAYVLPAGRIAYGVSLAAVPGCDSSEGTTTEVVLNLSDSQSGGAREVTPAQMRAEVPRNGALSTVGLDGGVFAKADNTQLSVCLNCDKDGKALGGQGHGSSRGPFPSSVSYWGSTFAD
jgi:hypothetical protein